MIFPQPIPFEQAIASQRAKAILPTTLSSYELSKLSPQLLEQSLFSARTNNKSHLTLISDILDRIINPTGELGDSWDESRARMAIRSSLRRIGYDPADIDAVPGSFKDLASEQRIRLILETNVKMAHGYGNWAQAQDPAILDEWPGSELTRHESRHKERTDWPARFLQAGGQLYAGRMIALKNSPIWVNLSRFGLPYAPFDYNSGMGLTDVDRDTCIAIGLIDRDTQIQPQQRPFFESGSRLRSGHPQGSTP